MVYIVMQRILSGLMASNFLAGLPDSTTTGTREKHNNAWVFGAVQSSAEGFLFFQYAEYPEKVCITVRLLIPLGLQINLKL